MKSTLYKRKKLILSLFLLTTSLLILSVAKSEVDPLLQILEKLTNKTDSVFRLSGFDDKTKKTIHFGSDSKIEISDQKYKTLVEEFRKSKTLLEKGFNERQNDEIGDLKLLQASTAATLYLQQQKRLYLNLLRNTHQDQKVTPKDWAMLKSLNLILPSSTATTLYLNDKYFGARFNVWHFKDDNGNYNNVEFGLNPQDISELEQEAIESANPSESNYKKLLQLMVARERTTNQWALNRLETGKFDQISYENTCGNSFSSFKVFGNGDYYQTLWAQDHGDELIATRKEIIPTTFDKPILSDEKLRIVIQRYLSSWKSYTPDSDPLLLVETKEARREFFENAPKKVIKEIEDAWKKDAEISIIDMNYPIDLIRTNELADRMAWASYQYREKSIVDFLVNTAVRSDVVEAKNNIASAIKSAESLVASVIGGDKNQYLAQLKATILESLSSNQIRLRIEDKRNTRFADILSKIKKSAERGVQAAYVLKDIDLAKIAHSNSWEKSGQIIYSLAGGKGEFQLGYIPHRGYLNDSVSLYTPDQLSLFFNKKLAFWDQTDGFWVRADRSLSQSSEDLKLVLLGPVFPAATLLHKNSAVKGAYAVKAVSDIATKIRKNDKVMRGIQSFFGELADKYYEELKSSQLLPANVTPENSPLKKIIIDVAKSNFEKFQTQVTGKKPDQRSISQILLNGPQINENRQGGNRTDFLKSPPSIPIDNTRVVRNLILPNLKVKPVTSSPTDPKSFITPVYASRDATRIRPIVLPPVQTKEPSSFISDEEKQKETIELYVQALALLNIAELVLNRSEKIPYDNLTPLMVYSPLAMEHLLNATFFEKRVENRIVKSLLDQKLASEIIKTEMQDEQPILAIRSENKLDAPSLIDNLIPFYSPSNGLNTDSAKNVIWHAIQEASSNAKGLIEEVCTADTIGKDSKFQRIFETSPALRAAIINKNRAYEKFDVSLKKEFRSNWQKFQEDWLDPICQLAFLVSMIAMAIYFAPVAYAGLSAMVATGSISMTAFGAGATGALEVAGITGVRSIFSTLLSGSFNKIIAHLFLTQAALWWHVNCYELPMHLQYQLGVSQSQIGMFAKSQITNSEIVKFYHEVRAKKIETYLMTGMIAIPEGAALLSKMNKAMGVSTTAALEKMGTIGGKEADEIVEKIRAKRLSEFQQEQGFLKGTKNYALEKLNALRKLGQHEVTEQSYAELVKEHGAVVGSAKYARLKYNAFINLGRVNSLGSNASNESIRKLLTMNMAELLSEDPKVLSILYENEALELNNEGKRIMNAFRPDVTGEKVIEKSVNGTWIFSQEFKDWLKAKTTKIGLKRYWKIVVANDALEAALTGKLLEGIDDAKEITAFVQFEYVKGLLSRRDFLLQNKFALDSLLESGELDSRQALEQHFRVMGDEDWAGIEQLFRWQSQNSEGIIRNAINKAWASKSEVLHLIRGTFRDYHKIRGEMEIIDSRKFFGKASHEYFTHNGKDLGPEFQIGTTQGPVTEFFSSFDDFGTAVEN